ncbi:HAD family phosphatase [Candidatus Saccharibacteria bacterium]|nr:HAD family phosphatase [Candidatus Saccharibacteria bacterium]
MFTIDSTKVRAVIFDMDGTMIDNMAYHKKAWRAFLKQHHMDVSDEEFRRKVSGKKNDQIFRTLFQRDLSQHELEAYADEKEALYRKLYEPEIREVEGLVRLVHQLYEHDIQTAIATTAPAKNREFGLRALGLENAFDIILGEEHVMQGKPHPEIYLKAAIKLGVDPAECLVLEDSPPGVQSAKAAGMTCVGILTSHSAEDIHESDATENDFTEITVA